MAAGRNYCEVGTETMAALLSRGWLTGEFTSTTTCSIGAMTWWRQPLPFQMVRRRDSFSTKVSWCNRNRLSDIRQFVRFSFQADTVPQLQVQKAPDTVVVIAIVCAVFVKQAFDCLA